MINEKITAPQLRLNTETGTHGIVSLAEALRLAENSGLDLVLIAPLAEPPVAKIMDYGKFKFDFLKREKEARKKQKVSELKEMQLSLYIADNDLNIKAKKVRKFLEEGDKVKVALKMHGRQLANPEQGIPVVRKFAEILSDISEISQQPAVNGRQIIMILQPLKK